MLGAGLILVPDTPGGRRCGWRMLGGALRVGGDMGMAAPPRMGGRVSELIAGTNPAPGGAVIDRLVGLVA